MLFNPVGREIKLGRVILTCLCSTTSQASAGKIQVSDESTLTVQAGIIWPLWCLASEDLKSRAADQTVCLDVASLYGLG